MTVPRGSARNLAIFTVVVLASGWVGRLVDVQAGSSGTESIGMLIWIVTPLATAVLLRTFAGDGWRDAGLGLRLRGNMRWYALALALYPAVTVLLLALGGVAGSIDFSGWSWAPLGRAVVAGALPLFVKNIFEEFAWRGYLTPKVHASGVQDLAGHAIVGLIWGLWHLPYFFFFLDRALIARYTSADPTTFALMGVVTMVAWAFAYGELRLVTGAIWPAVLMHVVEDATVNELLIEGHIRIDAAWEWLLSPGIGVLNAALVLAAGLAVHRRRRRARAPQMSE